MVNNAKSFDLLDNPSQNILRLAYRFIKSASSWHSFMVLLPFPLTSNVGGQQTYYTAKFQLHHNQHCSVGGRGGTIILLHGQSHNFCEGLSEIYKKIVKGLFSVLFVFWQVYDILPNLYTQTCKLTMNNFGCGWQRGVWSEGAGAHAIAR